MKTEKNDSIHKWYWISPTIHAGTEPRVREKYWLPYACNIGAVWGSVSLDLLSTVHYSLLPTKALWFFIHPIGRFKIFWVHPPRSPPQAGWKGCLVELLLWLFCHLWASCLLLYTTFSQLPQGCSVSPLSPFHILVPIWGELLLLLLSKVLVQILWLLLFVCMFVSEYFSHLPILHGKLMTISQNYFSMILYGLDYTMMS